MIAGAVLAAAVVAYFALGMPGTGRSSPGRAMAGVDDVAAAGDLEALAPQDFADRRTDDGVFVVNVHVPAAESITGTDATIAFDDIVGDDRLPAETDTPILLYCRTGRMSATAGRDLLAAGYTDVSHLDGGTEAWARAGFDLEQP